MAHVALSGLFHLIKTRAFTNSLRSLFCLYCNDAAESYLLQFLEKGSFVTGKIMHC